MAEINLNNTAKWDSADLPIGTYFMVENITEHMGKVFLKTYGGKYVNILKGAETYGANVFFKDCIIISKLKISFDN